MPIEEARRDAIRRSAEWLGIFHSIGASELAPLGSVLDIGTIGDALEDSIAENCAALRGNHTESAEALSDLKHKLTKISGENVAVVRTHGDFTPQNVIVNRREIIGFDFTADAAAPAMTDVASFLLPLLWYGSLKDFYGKGKRFRSDLELFLKYYTKYGPAHSPDISTLFCLIELMRRQQILQKQIAVGGFRKRWSKLSHLKAIRRVFIHMAGEFA